MSRGGHDILFGLLWKISFFTPQKVKLLDLFQLCFRNSVRNWSISINSVKYFVLVYVILPPSP